jgi:hypothetical protein
MTIDYIATPDDAREELRLQYLHDATTAALRARNRKGAIFNAFGGMALAASGITLGLTGSPFTGGLLFGVGVMLFLVCCLLLKITGARNANKSADMLAKEMQGRMWLGPRRVTFHDDHIESRAENAELRYTWHHVGELIESPAMIAISSRFGAFLFFIPTRAFSGPEDRQQCIDLIRHRLVKRTPPPAGTLGVRPGSIVSDQSMQSKC